MKAILLAAGKGKRISRMIQEVPKSSLPIAGKPLIQITVELLSRMNFDISVCVGYKQNIIRDILEDFPVKYYVNPFFDITNSIASLWFAKEELDDDMLIINADVFFSEDILRLLLEDPHKIVLAVDRTRTVNGDYFFATTENGAVKEYGKDLPFQRRTCEYVGVARIDKSQIGDFTHKMIKLVGEQKHDMWWEDILYSFVKEGEKEVYSKDVDGLFWSEIDYFDDYERILNYIKSLEGHDI